MINIANDNIKLIYTYMKYLKHIKESLAVKARLKDFIFSGVPTSDELNSVFMNLIDEDAWVILHRLVDFGVALKGPSGTINKVTISWEYSITSDIMKDNTVDSTTAVDDESYLTKFTDMFQLHGEKLEESLIQNTVKKLEQIDSVESVKLRKNTLYYYTIIVSYKKPSFAITPRLS